MNNDYIDDFMVEALKEAAIALKNGEVPVGCVLVYNGAIVARGHNQTNILHNALEHAEFIAARMLAESAARGTNHGPLVQISSLFENVARPGSESSQQVEALRPCPMVMLDGADLYVTVEPCIMCASMLLQRRIGRVFFGCRNPRFGGNGTILPVHECRLACNSDRPNNGYSSFEGFRADEAIQLLQKFYSQENQSAPEHKRRKKEKDC